jgi:hypothetical protein
LLQRFGDKHAASSDIVDHQHGRDRMGAGVGPFGRLRLQPSQKRLCHFLHLAAAVLQCAFRESDGLSRAPVHISRGFQRLNHVAQSFIVPSRNEAQAVAFVPKGH